jgi:hypothetical protein
VVTGDPEFAADPTLTDIRARAWSLQAQALLACDQPRKARQCAREAHRLASALDDTQGLAAVQALKQTIDQALSAKLAHDPASAAVQQAAATPLATLLSGVNDPAAQRQVLLTKASAELQSERPDAAAQLAHQVLALAKDAGHPRDQVLALLTLARAAPDQAVAWVTKAHRCADAASDPNLITAVVRAASLAGVELDPTAPRTIPSVESHP